MTETATQIWTTRRLLAWMNEAFMHNGLDSPRLMAEMILSHVLGCQRLRLYMEPDRPATELERNNLRDLVSRALKHEPVQYLVGEAWFFGLPFSVDKRVLIPRPATQTIVEYVLQHARNTPGFGGASGDGVLLADICTGSGCIATSLLYSMKMARAIATDISADALEVARLNAIRHGVIDRIELLEGDLTAPLLAHPAAGAHESLHYIVSNPPYIPDDEWEAVAPNVKDHEPHGALRGGADGLGFLRRLLESAPPLLKPGGMLLIEIAESRFRQAEELAAANPLLDAVRVLNDLENKPRVVVATRK
ncbi:MAG: peptide chain release factor N(5)-glutamine methyltransferase [Phycisphaeraceae bacterium]|nr:peptide chain release factor N(5)-glutamine methyltransferase [Phycisphaeraceae bacterium]